MGLFSGIYAAVNGQTSVRNWGVNVTSSTKPYVNSATKGGTGRRRGVIDWTGNMSQHGGKPLVMPGETFAFVGYTAPSDGAEGSNGTRYSGNAIVDSIALNWNWETADIINFVTNFGAVGPLTSADGAAILDAEFPDAPTPVDLPVMIFDEDGGSGGWSELCDVVSASLNITAANKSFANSCTNGHMSRKPGPIDWNMSLALHNEDFLNDLPFEINDILGFRLPVNETEYWEIMWGIVQGYSNFVVDRETAGIIGVTVNIEMAGFNHDSEEVGRIVLPGESEAWWGEDPA